MTRFISNSLIGKPYVRAPIPEKRPPKGPLVAPERPHKGPERPVPPERPQRGSERPIKAQRSPEKPRESQRGRAWTEQACPALGRLAGWLAGWLERGAETETPGEAQRV